MMTWKNVLYAKLSSSFSEVRSMLYVIIITNV